MSETTQESAAPTPRKTLGDALHRQKIETEEGIGIPIYLGDENPANYLGFVKAFKDPEGYNKKLNKLKSRKPKAHQWSDAELYPLRMEAELGTYWRGIGDWVDEAGKPLADTEENLRAVMAINFVRELCNTRIQDDASWDEMRKAELQGN
jgi:hypothetical protein